MPPAARTIPRRLARRRVLAGAALALCIAANIWTVAFAAEEPGGAGGAAAQRGLSTASGLRGGVPDGSPSGTAALPVVEEGDGHLRPVAIDAADLTSAARGRTVRISVEVEGGLPVDANDFAATVGAVLSDPRGWQTEDRVRFVALSPAEVAKGADVDLRIALVSPATTDQLCAPLQTRGEVSCHNQQRAVINLRRWQLGAGAYQGDLAGYRTYVINHEVGHGLGHGHVQCGGAGQPAPIMMQQTYGLAGCTAWPWPTAKPA